MNILISGGAGFIGSHTADALIAAGHQIRIIDNLHQTVHPKGRPDYLNPDAEFIHGDVRDKNTWKNGLKGMDAVYHLDAYQDYLPDFSTYFHVNAVSTALLYEVIVEEKIQKKIKKIIIAASQAVMGEGRYQCPHCYPADHAYIYPKIRLEEQLSKGDSQTSQTDNTNQSKPVNESYMEELFNLQQQVSAEKEKRLKEKNVSDIEINKKQEVITLLNNALKLLPERKTPEQIRGDWEKRLEDKKRIARIMGELKGLGFTRFRKRKKLINELDKSENRKLLS